MDWKIEKREKRLETVEWKLKVQMKEPQKEWYYACRQSNKRFPGIIISLKKKTFLYKAKLGVLQKKKSVNLLPEILGKEKKKTC